MKDKVINFIERFKSEISLLVISLGVTLLTSVICSLFGASDLTQVVVSASVGIIAVMGLEYLEEFIGMKLGDNKRPAYLGIIIGVLIALF